MRDYNEKLHRSINIKLKHVLFSAATCLKKIYCVAACDYDAV